MRHAWLFRQPGPSCTSRFRRQSAANTVSISEKTLPHSGKKCRCFRRPNRSGPWQPHIPTRCRMECPITGSCHLSLHAVWDELGGLQYKDTGVCSWLEPCHLQHCKFQPEKCGRATSCGGVRACSLCGCATASRPHVLANMYQECNVVVGMQLPHESNLQGSLKAVLMMCASLTLQCLRQGGLSRRDCDIELTLCTIVIYAQRSRMLRQARPIFMTWTGSHTGIQNRK